MTNRDPTADELSKLRTRVAELEAEVRVLRRGRPTAPTAPPRSSAADDRFDLVERVAGVGVWTWEPFCAAWWIAFHLPKPCT